MPRDVTKRVSNRKKAVLEMLSTGCKTTSHVVQALNITHSEATYVLNTLVSEGYIKKWIFGKVAIWCLNDEEYNKTVNTLLGEIRRLVETYKLKYVYPMRLLKLIIKDDRAFKVFSQYVPIDKMTLSLTFLNHLLRMLYGEPYTVGDKTVYLTVRAVESPIEVAPGQK